MIRFESALGRHLSDRGLVRDCTDPARFDALVAGGGATAFAGFDPTADSLHAGHLATLAALRAHAAAGVRTVALVGTATALIGDPTGRSDARPLLSEEAVERNADGLEDSIRRALRPFDDRVEIRRNGDWLRGLGLVGFLREVGRLVPVSRLLALEGVRGRLEADGMSFLELAYPLMQAFDFLHLSREFGPVIQVGGSDQWGNICAGLDLVARSGGAGAPPCVGLTHPLLTHADGRKMGKTSGGAAWLDPARLSDFDFFRFWRTLPDGDVSRVTLMVSDLHAPCDAAGDAAEASKEALAVEMTTRIRGADAARAALLASRSRGTVAAGLPSFRLPAGCGADLAGALVLAGLAGSRSAARRLGAQGGVSVNGRKREAMALVPGDFAAGVAVVSAGKTRHAALLPPDGPQALEPGANA